MYLNLDLLYNIYDYLYPLFYYNHYYYKIDNIVYSPMTKKFLFKYPSHSIYYDFITKKRCCLKPKRIGFYSNYIFTENTFNRNGVINNKCKPFKLNSEDLYFLKSNIKIN